MYPENFTLSKLKYFRKANGFTQKQIADIIGVDRSTYAYYESGKSMPSLDIVTKLIMIFKVDFNELFIDDGLSDSVTAAPILHDSDDVMYMVDLTGDEKKLISHFRIMMASQQKALLRQLGVVPDEDEEDEDRIKPGFRFK